MDPRFKNDYGNSNSLANFISSYADRLGAALKSVDADALESALGILAAAAREDRHTYAIGNGGSAAIADHLCCDLTKGTDAAGHAPLMTHSMGASGPLYSALANDFSFEEVFSKQVDFFCRKSDVLIAISSSGNSPNIIRAVKAAREKNLSVIGLSGFGGGELRKLADVSLHVPIMNYGIVEDCHQSLMHIMAQVAALRRDASIRW